MTATVIRQSHKGMYMGQGNGWLNRDKDQHSFV